MATLAVQKLAWDALSEGKKATVLDSAEYGVEVQLGEPVISYVDESSVEWLVWDDPALSENTIALVAAQMANPELIIETTWEEEDAG